jgi:hypothetical protein
MLLSIPSLTVILSVQPVPLVLTVLFMFQDNLIFRLKLKRLVSFPLPNLQFLCLSFVCFSFRNMALTVPSHVTLPLQMAHTHTLLHTAVTRTLYEHRSTYTGCLLQRGFDNMAPCVPSIAVYSSLHFQFSTLYFSMF